MGKFLGNILNKLESTVLAVVIGVIFIVFLLFLGYGGNILNIFAFEENTRNVLRVSAFVLIGLLILILLIWGKSYTKENRLDPEIDQESKIGSIGENQINYVIQYLAERVKFESNRRQVLDLQSSSGDFQEDNLSQFTYLLFKEYNRPYKEQIKDYENLIRPLLRAFSPYLINILENVEDDELRLGAIYALIDIKAYKAEPYLIKIIEDDQRSISITNAVVLALGELRAQNAVQALAKAYVRSNLSSGTKDRIQRALKNIGTQEAISVMKKLR